MNSSNYCYCLHICVLLPQGVKCNKLDAQVVQARLLCMLHNNWHRGIVDMYWPWSPMVCELGFAHPIDSYVFCDLCHIHSRNSCLEGMRLLLHGYTLSTKIVVVGSMVMSKSLSS